MFRIFRFLTTVIQVILLFDSTQQQRVKQAMATVKTIANNIKIPFMKTLGNTMKNPVGMLRRNKSIMKNIAYSFKEKQLSPNNNFGSKNIKYLGKEATKKFKSTTPQAFRAQGKKDIYMRSAAQMSRKEIGYMVKRSTSFMRGKELSSLINMVSKSKPQLPFLAGGSLMSMTQLSLVPDTSINQPEYRTDLDDINFTEKTKLTLSDGSIYEGDVMRDEICDRMHGIGRLTYMNLVNDKKETGDVYEGNFVNTQLEGLGRVKYVNKDLYEGNFVKSKPHGDGRLIKANQDTYVGKFAKGLPEGKGVYTLESGNVYKGDHVAGKMEGKGSMTYHNDNVYTGEWKDNLRHGYGHFDNNLENSSYDGFWQNDIYFKDVEEFDKVVEFNKGGHNKSVFDQDK